MNDNLGFVTAGVTAVSVAAAYILYGLRSSGGEKPASRRRRFHSSPGHIPGLVNSGNTCFVNSLLQALASLTSFYEWIRITRLSQARNPRKFADTSLLSDFGSTRSSPLIEALSVAVSVLNDHEESFTGNVYNPAAVLDSLRDSGWRISADEQDLHEFFVVLLDSLDETLRRSTNRQPSICDAFLPNRRSEERLLVSEDRSKLLARHTTIGVHTRHPAVDFFSSPSKKLDMPFQGLVASQLICTQCSYRTALRHDSFCSLSLTFPPVLRNNELFSMDVIALAELLRNYFTSDTVDEVFCPKCTENVHGDGEGRVKRTFIKDTSIGKLPKCLCLHIQRTCWLPDGRCVKRMNPIDFPEYINLKEFVFKPKMTRRNSDESMCHSPSAPSTPKKLGALGKSTSVDISPNTPGSSSSPSETTIYQLKSVVEHLGDVSSGHFVTYRRGPIGSNLRDSWFYTSDTRVHPTSRSHVSKAVPYILFYERVQEGAPS